MASREKTLWVVQYENVFEFVAKAVATKATSVAIRTDNDLLKAIPLFHKSKIKVYGWRWPSAMRDAAMKEADKVVKLFANGLDGYYVDPEGAPGKPWDWDQKGLEALSDDFCRAIVTTAAGRPFGMTSHYRAKKVFVNLPWETFFKYSTVLLPQAYWRSDGGVIGHGIPEDNYRVSLDFWSKAGGDQSLIAPMAGELALSTPNEIDSYVKVASELDMRDLHFYAFSDDVKAVVWNAVARA